MDVLTVFVYHGSDQQGALLALFLQEHDLEKRFQYLVLQNDEDLSHNAAFLREHCKGATVEMPYIVLVYPSGQRVVVYGEKFDEWMSKLMQAALQHDGVNGVRSVCLQLFNRVFRPSTLQMMSAVFGTSGSPSPTAGAAAQQQQAMMAPRSAPTMVIAGRHTGGRIINSAAHSHWGQGNDATEDEGEEDVVISTVPTPVGGASKSVNVAAIMAAEGKMRESVTLSNV